MPGLKLIHVSKRDPWCQDIDGKRLIDHDVITLKHCPHYWPSVREIHQSPLDYPFKESVMQNVDDYLYFFE